MRARLIVVLSLVGSLLTPGAASAQIATPAASPIALQCAPDPFCGLAGFQGEVQRTFETFGAGYVIPQVMTFGIVAFATPAQAAAALQTLLVDLRGPQTPTQDVSTMTVASMTPLGDRAKALDGLVTRTDATGKRVTRVEACFVIQTGIETRPTSMRRRCARVQLDHELRCGPLVRDQAKARRPARPGRDHRLRRRSAPAYPRDRRQSPE